MLQTGTRWLNATYLVAGLMGEIYHLSDSQFLLLDELEWYPDFYQRIVIPTHYGDAWMYIVKAELCQEQEMIPGCWP